jgi:hypothetical protein
VVVVTENVTSSRGDLCAAFNRSTNQLGYASVFGAGKFEIHIQLSKLSRLSNRVGTPEFQCQLGIVVSSNSVGLGAVSGGARVNMAPDGTGYERVAVRDCIDAVLADLMTKKVVPLMQQYVAGLAPPANSPGAPNPTPAQPAPSAPAP